MKKSVKGSSNKGRGMGQKIRIMLITAALALGPAVFAAPAATAGTYDDLTGKPGQECRPISLGNSAGSGFPGKVDPAPLPILANGPSPAAAEQAATLEEGANKSIYHVYGWAGYNWETCATGGPVKGAEALGNTSAWGDSEIGSTLLKTATAIAALNTGIAKMAANPSSIMKPFDDIVVQLSTVVRTVFVDYWLPLLVMGAAALIAVNALNKNARKATISVAAIFASLLGIAFLSFAPLKAAQAMDGIASGVQTAVLSKALEVSGRTDVPAEETWGVIYTEGIIFPLWANGLTNWAQGDARLTPSLDAERLGNDIDKKQKFEKFTPTQAYQLRAYAWGAEVTADETNDRRDAWNTIGEASQTPDAPTRAFAGQENNRAGSGFMALVSVLAVAGFSIPANLMIFLALLVFRLLPIIGLLACLLLAFEPTRHLATKIGRFFFSAIINGIVLGSFAAIHLAIVSALFRDGTSFLWSTILTAIISIVFFKLTKPVQAFAGVVKGAGQIGGSGAKRALSAARRSVNGPTQNSRNNPKGGGAGSTAQSSASDVRQVAPLKHQPSTRTPRRRPALDGPVVKAGLQVASKIPQTAAVARGAQAVIAAKGAGAKMPGRSAAGRPGNRATTAPGSRPRTTGRSNTGRPGGGTPTRGNNATSGGAYKSLQQAQRSGETRSRQQRVFIPPNSSPAPARQVVRNTERGDKPTPRKFQPPARQSNNVRQDGPVKPLKSRS